MWIRWYKQAFETVGYMKKRLMDVSLRQHNQMDLEEHLDKLRMNPVQIIYIGKEFVVVQGLATIIGF